MKTQLRIWFVILVAVSSLNAFAAQKKSKVKSAPPPVEETTVDWSQHPFGLGAVLGEPTGITGKYWLDTSTAIDGGVAYSYSNFFLFYGDYLWHFPGAFGNKTKFVSELTPYVGGGVDLFIETQTSDKRGTTYYNSSNGTVGLALRIPIGTEWRPSTVPIGVFVEIVPGIGIVPSTFGLFEGGIGARYYF